MPEATSLAQTLASVKPVNESDINFKPDNVPHSVRSDIDDSAINGDNNSITKKSADKTGPGADDFDKVLSQKIDGQKEQTFVEYPQENAIPAETAELNLTRHKSHSTLAQVRSPFEYTDAQSTPEQSVAEICNPLKNADTLQLAVNAGITGETINPVNQTSGQPSKQAQETVAQLPVSPEQSISMKITAETELPVVEKQVHFQKAVMTDSADVSAGNSTEAKIPQIPEAMEQSQKQLSDSTEPEIRPVRGDQDKSIHSDPDPQAVLRGDQDKSVHSDFQAVLQGDRQERPRDFQSQSDNSGATGQFQDETQEIKGIENPQGVSFKEEPLEVEISIEEQDGVRKGFEVRNVQSMLHSATPAENASLSALEVPSRTGVHSDTPLNEITKPVDQILQHLNSVSVSGPQQRIQLTLTPEHLGTVRITFNQTEDEVVGILEVQNNQTRREVEQSLPQLISAMQSSGVQVRRIEVVQWNAGQDSVEGETAKESDYSAASQFHDESPSNSSESEIFENARFSVHGQISSQLSQITEQDNPIYDVDITEGGLNMFI